MGVTASEAVERFIADRPEIDRPLLRAFLASRLSKGVRFHTTRYYIFCLRRLPSPIPNDPAALELALAKAQETLSPASCAGIWRAWRAFYAWAHRRYGLKNLTEQIDPPIRRPHVPRVFSDAELKAADKAAGDLRDRTFIAVALSTFARRSELAAMRWRDVDGDFLFLRSTKGRVHWVPLDARARSLLDQLRERDEPAADDPVWLTERGTPLTLWGVVEIWRRITRRAGITGKRRGLHTIRHSAITRYLDNSGDLYRAQQIAGHTSPKTTELYIHLTRQQLLRGFEDFSPGRLLREEGTGK